MSIPHNHSISNPGSGHYDGRNDLGYVKTNNGGLGDEWKGKDALDNPVGPFDDRKNRLLNKGKDEEDIEDIDIEIHNKIGTTFSVQQSDPYSIKKTDPFYYANQYLSDGVVKSTQLIESYIKSYLLNELGISGNIAVASSPKGKNTGNKSKHYHIDNTTLSSMGGVHSGVYINQVYKQLPDSDKDGARYMASRNTELDSIDSDWEDSDDTTAGNLNKALSQKQRDSKSITRHNK